MCQTCERLTFWPRFVNSQFSEIYRILVRQFLDLRPPPSTEFRCATHGHSGLVCLSTFWKTCLESHSKHIFIKYVFLLKIPCQCLRARVPGPGPGRGPAGPGSQGQGTSFFRQVDFLQTGIHTSYRYTYILQVYIHPTGIQKSNIYTKNILVKWPLKTYEYPFYIS